MQTPFKSLVPLSLIVCLAAVGCGAPAPAELPPVSNTSAASADESPSIVLAREFEENGSIAFGSRGDDQAERESELTLTLLPDGAAEVAYHGSPQAVSSGTYSIDDQNRLHFNFGPQDPWPTMRLTVQDGIMLVNAPEKEEIIRTAFQAGLSREEITDEDVQSAFQDWPLRQAVAPN